LTLIETPAAMLPVDIHALPDGVHLRTLHPSETDLGLEPGMFDDIVVDLRLDVAGRRIVAQFEVRATATLVCDRTLVDFEQAVSGSHAVLFAPPEQLGGGESDDAVPLEDDDATIDLAAPVRDTLLLSLPARRVAPGAEDVEIPTAFGAETDDDGRPVDPRWDALRALREAPDGDGR
jgi:uncharacterized metal-binding protein YceD (DUF177 family)